MLATSLAPRDEMNSSHKLCRALIWHRLKVKRCDRSAPWSTESRMSQTGRATSSTMRVRCSLQLAVLVLGVSFSVRPATPTLESIPIPGTKAFPESITSTTDGTLYVGRLGDGGIVRVKPRTRESTIFVQPGTSGSRSILGVFADEASNTLWAC